MPYKYQGTSLDQVIDRICTACLNISDPLIRLLACLEAGVDAVDGIGSTLTLLTQPQGPGTLALERMVDVGTWGPRERAARDAYFGDPNHVSDPFAEAFCRRDFASGPSSAIRQDCLSDDDWYGSPHFENFRKRADMDSAIYVVLPVAFGTSETRIFGLSINRRLGSPQFTAEERDFVQKVVVGLTPLLELVWLPENSPLDDLIKEVPLRLRKVLALLVGGMSEKDAAQALDLSPHTVHTYVKQLYLHFGVRNRAQLIAQVGKYYQ